MSFLLLIAVIALWFAGLVLWDVSGWRARTFLSLTGILRFIVGAMFIFGALVLLYLSFPGMRQGEMSWFAIGSFLIALIADFMIGDDIRALFRPRRPTR